MKKRANVVLVLAIIVFLSSPAFAIESFNTCNVYNQINSVNRLGIQNQHFTCCQNGICKSGNGLRRHINLEDMEKIGAHGQADINVYNYNGLDRAKIVLRTEGLPKNQVFTVWMIQGDNIRSKLGNLKTNFMGRGQLTFSQQYVSDFNNYHTIVVEWGDPVLYLKGNMNFTETRIPVSYD